MSNERPNRSGNAQPTRPKLLPITITRGMPVVNWSDNSAGTIAGITETFCIYHLDGSNGLWVAAWRELAVGNLCPAAPLLSDDLEEIDRRNASATLLRELIGMDEFGLTAHQTATRDELIAYLCGADTATEP